jgi:hypothetical protein
VSKAPVQIGAALHDCSRRTTRKCFLTEYEHILSSKYLIKIFLAKLTVLFNS